MARKGKPSGARTYPSRRRRTPSVPKVGDRLREQKARLKAVENRVARIETLMKIYDSQRREALDLLGPEEE